MEQVGQIWANFLENVTNDRLEDALNELMRLSNSVLRMDDGEKEIASELEKEGEKRLNKVLSHEIQRITKQSISNCRNGDVSNIYNDFQSSLRLLSIRVGVDLISKSNSGQETTLQCRTPIKQMLITYITVRCFQKRDELRARLDIKKKAKTTVTSSEDGFIETIEACVADVAEMCKLCYDAETPLSSEDQENAFFTGLITSIHEVGANCVKQMMEWFWEDRRVKSFWYPRADELGGLTLPRAMASNQDHSTPSRPSSSNSAKSPNSLKPLDEQESISLDLVLHEVSQILSLCSEFQKGVLDEISLDFVSAMVKLDELWLTHNVTKAVNHAVSIEIEPPIWVNSISEDTFQVVGTCFARAVNSGSLFAAEATANHVAGFISDGFFEMIKELVRRDAPKSIQHKQTENKNASRAVAAIGTDDVASNVHQSRGFTTSIVSPFYIEAINTLASACSFTLDIKDEMKHSFETTFNYSNAMAPLILEEALHRMEALLEDSNKAFAKALILSKATRILNDALDPRAQPYELGVVAFERESIAKTSWVKEYVDAQFRTNRAFQESLPTLSHLPASQIIQFQVKIICEMFEERISRLRFTALGALQFDKDVRTLCETIITECTTAGEGIRASSGVAGFSYNGALLDDSRIYDAQIRPQFKRLRHWAFLLNLERASDQKEIAFPGNALDEEQIQFVLQRRAEQDFFH